jgi:hypothetical protein
LPVHSIYITAVGTSSDIPVTSTHGIRIDCIINEYISKEKIVQIPITIFHPFESRLKKQTTNIRRGSSLFFSGEITLIEGILYLELHNLSFLAGQQQSQTPSKTTSLPWSNTKSSSSSTSQGNAHLIHQEPRTPESAKYKSQKPFQPKNISKLADIAINALANKGDKNKEDEDERDNDERDDEDDEDEDKVIKNEASEDINDQTSNKLSEDADKMVVKNLIYL